MKRARGLILLLAALAVGSAVAAPGAHGPDGEHLDRPLPMGAAGPVRLADGSVHVPKAAQRRMAVRTLLATVSQAAATVELPGRVVADPNASGRVQAARAGRIEPGPRGLPVAGQSVRRGEVLAYLRPLADPLALGAQQALLAQLQAEHAIAQARRQRLQELEATVARKEIEAARLEADALAERSRRIAASLQAREALLAPVAGVIARSELAAGQVVEARELLAEVVDPSRLLVEATTTDAGLAARIARAHLHGLPEARLRLVGAARALRDGVLPLTFGLRAAGGAPLPLALGAPVTLVIELDQRVRGIVLPAQAIVRGANNEPVVWIKAGAERFIAQPVQWRALDAHRIVVTQGLGADNRVVVQGAPLIAQIR